MQKNNNNAAMKTFYRRRSSDLRSSQSSEKAKRIVLTRSALPGTIFLVLLGIVATIALQMDSRFQVMVYGIWLILPFYIGITHLNDIVLGKRFLTIMLSIIVLTVICIFSYLGTGKNGYLNGFLLLLAKCFLIYTAGYFLVFSIDIHRRLGIIVGCYVVAALVYALWVYTNYFPGFSTWLSSTTYLFGSKNSFGQVAGIAVICCVAFLLCDDEAISNKVLLLSVSIVLFIAVTLAQCRTAMLGIALAVFAMLAMKGKRKAIVLIAALLILAFVIFPRMQSLLFHAFFLDVYQDADANTFSSGRLLLWSRSIDVIVENPWIGAGKYYVDCLYLNLFACLGVIGSIPVLVIWGIRIWAGCGKKARTLARCNETIYTLMFGATVFYLFESVLEGLPPFGPGACSFVFWLLSGVVDGEEECHG